MNRYIPPLTFTYQPLNTVKHRFLWRNTLYIGGRNEGTNKMNISILEPPNFHDFKPNAYTNKMYISILKP